MKTITETNSFWLVWRQSSGYTNYEHNSRKSADAEAQRLSRQCPGERFFVLKTAACFEAPIMPVGRIKLTPPKPADDDDEIPF